MHRDQDATPLTASIFLYSVFLSLLFSPPASPGPYSAPPAPNLLLIVVVIDVFAVWQHMLLQLSAPSPLLLPAVPREGAAVQAAAEEPEEGDTTDLPGRPLLLHCHTEEESRDNRTQEVYHQAEEGEW